MPTTDSNGIIRYLDTDGAPTPPVLNLGMQSVSDALTKLRDIKYVANVTERTALVATWVPTASKPLYVHRGDAPALERLESTIDGTTWVKHSAAPIVRPYAYADLRRSDGSAIINSGFTDLRTVGGSSAGVGWNTSWNGVGFYNPLPGVWWVQASIASNITGPRYLELGVKSIGTGIVGTMGPTTVDTAPTGFGRVTFEGMAICSSAFALSLQLSNTGSSGGILSGSFRAMWMGPA